jgi:hypothetical protein
LLQYNLNSVKIYIKGHLEFSGNISTINANSEQESVVVTARATQKVDNRKSVTLPMSSLNENLHPYHVLLHNPNIDNPILDENDDNPPYYKGVKVKLGTITEQNWSVWSTVDRTLTANQINDGSFNFKENWSYFWSYVDAKNIISGIQRVFLYIGTSLSQISEDVWNLIGIRGTYQRQFDDILTNDEETVRKQLEEDNPDADSDEIEELLEDELFYYKVGEAPYKEIYITNGQLITKNHYEDRDDGLYNVKDESYNYIGRINESTGATLEKGYVQRVADLEYQKLITTGGNVLPKTSCDFELMLDGYYFYNLSLLTRLNVSNTTTSNIYNANNGFPVSIKTIVINSNSLRVTLRADNTLSTVELEEIEDNYPDENSDEYIQEAEERFALQKIDMSTGEDVE